MKVTEIKNEGLELHCEVVIPSAKVEETVKNKLQDLSKNLKLSGFRPGKVPLKIVEQKYRTSVTADALQQEVEHHVGKIISDKKLKLATQAQVDDLDFKDGKDIKFKVVFEKMPDVNDVDFSKFKIVKPVAKIGDSDVNERIEILMSSKKPFKKSAKTSTASDGDKVVIDFEGFVDGKAFEGGKAQGHELILGSNAFIPDFEAQLVGSKAGDKVTVKVKFPENYRAQDLASKDSEFKVDVHEVHKPGKLEVTDELAKEFGAIDLADLRKKVKEMLENAFKEPSYTHQKMKLFDLLENTLDFDVPSSLLKKEKDVLSEQIKLHKDEDPEIKGKSEKDLDKYTDKIALRRVRIGLMLADYAEKNSLKLNPEDYRQAVVNQARAFPGSEQQVIDFYQKNPKAMQSLAGPVLEDKSVRHILENKVKVSEKEYSIDQFNKLMEELD